MSSTVRQNLGPLLTEFEPPSTCSTLGINALPPTVAYQAQHCYTTTSVPGTTVYTHDDSTTISIAVSATVTSVIYDAGVADDLTCRPPMTTDVIVPAGAYGFYSPGLLCPAGWHRACTGGVEENGSLLKVTGPHATTFPFEYGLLPGETAYGCCPPSYSCANNPQTCQSLVTSGSVAVTFCADYTGTSTSTLTFPTIYGTSTVSTMTALAPLIQIVFKSTDQHSVVTVTAAAESARGLDTGDKAAIGVGVVALLCLGLALVFGILLLRMRRLRKNWTSAEPGPPPMQPVYEARAKERNLAAETEGIPLTELADPQTDFGRSRW